MSAIATLAANVEPARRSAATPGIVCKRNKLAVFGGGGCSS